jgi:release factor glutamine methyltransferase
MADQLAPILEQIAVQLAGAGIERASSEARLLAARALGCDIAAIIADPHRQLGAEQSHALATLAARRASHEPMAYILGRREFYSLEFAVSASVLIPRPDSETLIDALLAAIPNRQLPLRLLDLGTGSGCLLLSLLKALPHASGVGLDRSGAALAVAGVNARSLGLNQRCRWIEGQWEAALSLGPFDIVVSNPPYIASAAIDNLVADVAAHEPRVALDGGADGLDAYRAIVPLLSRLLAPRGIAALEMGLGQGPEIANLLAHAEMEKIKVCQDLAGIDRVVLMHKTPKNLVGTRAASV